MDLSTQLLRIWEENQNFVDALFWQCVHIIDVIGDLTGLGYNLTNIVLFVILQPLLVAAFFVLWRIERARTRMLLSACALNPRKH